MSMDKVSDRVTRYQIRANKLLEELAAEGMTYGDAGTVLKFAADDLYNQKTKTIDQVKMNEAP